MSQLVRLQTIIAELREKCPWDKKQTFESLRKLTLEEVYELLEAIEHGEINEISHELGDLLMHVFFYANIAQEKQWFDLEEVAHKVCNRLIDRHPHIYGDATAKSAEEVSQNWEKIKQKNNPKNSILQGIPKTLPALNKAQRIQEKTASYGFDWKQITSVVDKLDEEVLELKEALKTNNPKHIEEEFGDILFTLVNIGRHLGIDAESSLSSSNQKFIERFQKLEKIAHNKQEKIADLSLKTLEAYWQQSKK